MIALHTRPFNSLLDRDHPPADGAPSPSTGAPRRADPQEPNNLQWLRRRTEEGAAYALGTKGKVEIRRDDGSHYETSTYSTDAGKLAIDDGNGEPSPKPLLATFH